MNTKALITLFQRDLKRLEDELQAYTSEKDLWLLPEGINNTAGNLALHLIGNLNHFIGATLGNTDYVRDREAEFGDKNVPRSKILGDLTATIAMIKTVFEELDEGVMDEEYPAEPLGRKVITGDFMLHLYGHLNYHLGQVNYHRRLLTA